MATVDGEGGQGDKEVEALASQLSEADVSSDDEEEMDMDYSSSEEEEEEEEEYYLDDEEEQARLAKRRSVTYEMYLEYLKAAVESEGFNVPKFEGVLSGGIVPASFDKEPYRQEIITIAEAAIQDFHTQNKMNTRYKFVEILSANRQCVAGTMFYITFKAQDTTDGTFQNFRAKVWEKLYNWGTEVKFCEKI